MGRCGKVLVVLVVWCDLGGRRAVCGPTGR